MEKGFASTSHNPPLAHGKLRQRWGSAGLEGGKRVMPTPRVEPGRERGSPRAPARPGEAGLGGATAAHSSHRREPAAGCGGGSWSELLPREIMGKNTRQAIKDLAWRSRAALLLPPPGTVD